MPGAAPAMAAATYLQKTVGSSSAGSSETHAVRAASPRAAIHWATSVVLPKPGGADTSISFDVATRPRRSSRRARSTALGRGIGVWILVARSSGTVPPSWDTRPVTHEPRSIPR